jgi:hypothetical protein
MLIHVSQRRYRLAVYFSRFTRLSYIEQARVEQNYTDWVLWRPFWTAPIRCWFPFQFSALLIPVICRRVREARAWLAHESACQAPLKLYIRVQLS